MARSKLSRRDFFRRSSGAAAAAGLAAGCARHGATVAKAPAPKFGPGKATPSETINLGFIGVAGRGRHLLDWFTAFDDVRIAAICDVYDKHRDEAIAYVGGAAKGYTDFRALLDQSDLDAVVIATPPHWHALCAVYACQAGKDVYCEKPMCLIPAEGRAMVKAARDNHRVTQVGTQIHSTANYQRAVEVVRSGMLGTISQVHAVLSLNEAPDGIGFEENEAPPAGLDWDMWLGPAQERPFNWNLYRHGHHRYFQPFIGSWIHEMGPHIVDLALWSMGRPQPKTVTAVGGKFATQDMSTIPDTLTATFDYGDFAMTWQNMCANSHGLAFDGGFEDAEEIQEHAMNGRRLGVTFHGAKGTLLADYGRLQVVAEGERLVDAELPPAPPAKNHGREFLDAIKTRELPNCDVEKHYPLHVALNLGNAAYQLGRSLTWDADAQRVVGDDAADAYIQPQYRSPWELPV